MKDYLNQEDRKNLLIIYCITEKIEKLIEGNALSDDEVERFTKIKDDSEKLILDLLDRLGEAERRKVVRSADSNVIVMQSKYAPYKERISHIAVEDIQKNVPELMMINCLNCQKDNFKDCAMYCMGIACDIPYKQDNGQCPYKTNINYEEDDDL